MHPVLYVDPASSVVSRRRHPELRDAYAEPKLRPIAPNLTRLSPSALPGMERPGMAAVTSALTARAIRHSARQLGARRMALIDTSPLAPVMGRCGESLRVYWAQDDYAGLAELLGLSQRRMADGERRLLRRADVVIAANPRVADRLREGGRPVELIPFGCDAEAFARAGSAEPPADIALPRPIAGFMGHIGDRIDLRMLAAVAETGSSLLLIGPRHPRFDASALDGLLARGNVQWVGPKEFGALPGYLGSVDVGLVPYNHSAFNEGSFPLKALEYLGAGLRVVATDLPAVRWLDSPDIAIEDEPAPFAQAVRKALKAPGGQRGEEAAPGVRPAAHLGRPGAGVLPRRVGPADDASSRPRPATAAARHPLREDKLPTPGEQVTPFPPRRTSIHNESAGRPRAAGEEAQP